MELTTKLTDLINTALDSKKKVEVLHNGGKVIDCKLIDFDQAGIYFTGYPHQEDLTRYDTNKQNLAEDSEVFEGEETSPISTFIPWHAVASISFSERF